MRLLLGMCGLPVPHVFVQGEETNQMCGRALFPSFKVLLVFFDRIFLSTLLEYQREILYQGMECVLVT